MIHAYSSLSLLILIDCFDKIRMELSMILYLKSCRSFFFIKMYFCPRRLFKQTVHVYLMKCRLISSGDKYLFIGIENEMGYYAYQEFDNESYDKYVIFFYMTMRFYQK